MRTDTFTAEETPTAEGEKVASAETPLKFSHCFPFCSEAAWMGGRNRRELPGSLPKTHAARTHQNKTRFSKAARAWDQTLTNLTPPCTVRLLLLLLQHPPPSMNNKHSPPTITTRSSMNHASCPPPPNLMAVMVQS